MRLMLAVLTLPSPLVIAGAWGYVASWLNEIIKQDGLPKWANTVIADAVLVLAAVIRTATTVPAGQSFWHAYWSALLIVVTAALANHQFFLSPTGIGAWLQSRTSLLKRIEAATHLPPTAPAAATHAHK